MGFTLGAQTRGFFAALLLGFTLALLYELLRALRLRRGRALTGALDALYCLALAVLVTRFALGVGGGELRLFMLFSALAGAAGYFAFCARFFRPLWAFWAEVTFEALALAALPFRAAKNFYGKLAKLCKRGFLFSKNRFIIKVYERRARYARRKEAKKEGRRHGGADEKSEKAHQSADDARPSGAARARRRGAAAYPHTDRRGER